MAPIGVMDGVKVSLSTDHIASISCDPFIPSTMPE